MKINGVENGVGSVTVIYAAGTKAEALALLRQAQPYIDLHGQEPLDPESTAALRQMVSGLPEDLEISNLNSAQRPYIDALIKRGALVMLG